MNAKVSVIVFSALLGSLSVLNIITPTRTFSENENRYLQELPTFSLESLVDGDFTADFDRYVTDQFFFRDGWVGLKALSELALHKQSSNGIYFAQDHYLIEMFDTVDREQYEKNLEFVGDFSRRVQGGLGVRVNTMLVPSASMILSDKLPSHAPEVPQGELLAQAAQEIPGFVDISSKLSAHADEYIYYRTDHHWTSLGAAYAYEEYRRQIGEPVSSDYRQEVLSDSFYGTTYSKASLYTAQPDTITAWIPDPAVAVTVDYNDGKPAKDSVYERSYLNVKDKYSVFLNANQPITNIKTDRTNGRKLLLVKDSYANTLVQMALPDYEEIVVVDLRYYKLPLYDYIEGNAVTDVLLLYSMKGFPSDTNLFYLST